MPTPASTRTTTPAPVDTAPLALTTTTPAALPTPVMLTTAEVAELLRVDVYTVRKWIRDGELPAYRIGRESRIDTNDLRGWLDSRRRTA